MTDNVISLPEVKLVEYSPAYRKFTETDVATGTVRQGIFKEIDSFSAKVIRQENHTIVILDNGIKGKSKCDPIDTFSRSKGIRIAYLRALVKHLNKEIKRICKED